MGIKLSVFAVIIACGVLFLSQYKKGCWYNVPQNLSLTGKYALITGANTGIGLETANEMAKLGATVIMACRSKTRCENAKNIIKTRLSNVDSIHNKLHIEIMDLASLQSVKDAAHRIRTTYPRLDYLINNAGVMMCPFEKTIDGNEMQFATNHLGHFLLTKLLLPFMKKNPNKVRIINVSSIGHSLLKWFQTDYDTRLNFTRLNTGIDYDSMVVYAYSKVANVLFTRELAQREMRDDKSNVITVSLHPGGVATELNRHMLSEQVRKIVLFIADKFILKTSLEGAQTTLHCALDDSVIEHNGEYYSDCVPTTLTIGAHHMGDARKLWVMSEQLTAKFQ